MNQLANCHRRSRRPLIIIQTVCVGLVLLIACLPADAGQRNRLKRPDSSQEQPVLQMQTPTEEPRNSDGSFDLRIRQNVGVDGASVMQSGTSGFGGLQSGVNDNGNGVLESGAAARTAVPNVTIRLEGGVSHQELQKLAKYDVAVLLDRSHSMTGDDCPPFSGTDPRGRGIGISRWEWCRQQTKPLASLASRTTGHFLNITTFFTTFTTYRNVTLDQVDRLFNEQSPNFEVGTCLDLALQDTLNQYFQRRAAGRANPLVIAIVTDGRVRAEKIQAVLFNAINQMRDPDEIQITMFLVGERTAINSRKMVTLSDVMRGSGARYDIVNTVPFQKLEQVGLAKALVQALP